MPLLRWYDHYQYGVFTEKLITVLKNGAITDMPNEHEFLINFPSDCLDFECKYVTALQYRSKKACQTM